MGQWVTNLCNLGNKAAAAAADDDDDDNWMEFASEDWRQL